MHIQHRLTPPYSPQCNLVERANRVIKTMIAQSIATSQETWDVYLPEIQFTYNTAHSESTAHTPAYLNFGRELRPPGSLAHEAAPASREKNQHRIEKLHAAIELARSQIARSFQKQQGYYNLRRRKWAPQIGDKVLRKVHQLYNKADNFNAKLAEKFEGPFTVVKKITSYIRPEEKQRKHHSSYTREGPESLSRGRNILNPAARVLTEQ